MAEDSSIYSTVGERSERGVSLATLHSRQVRFVYLITYSQADLDLVPTREVWQSLPHGCKVKCTSSLANSSQLFRTKAWRESKF